MTRDIQRPVGHSPARQLADAARGGAKHNQRVGMWAAGANVALGLFFIGVELVTPSPPGRSAVPVGLGFIAFGLLIGLLLRFVLRKRRADAEAMPQQLEQRAQRVEATLARDGSFAFDARPVAEARSRAIFLPLLVGVVLGLVDYALARKHGIDVGWTRLVYLLLPIGGWLIFPWFRGPRFELTQTSLTRARGTERETLTFSALTATHHEIIRVVRAQSVVGFYVKLTLESGPTRIQLADLLAARPPGARGPYGDEIVVGDVLCWLWLRRASELRIQPFAP